LKSITGKRRDAANTKATILDAAIVEFAHSGPAGSRVDEIAARAGVNKSLIYQYFGSKQELYAEALTMVLQSITERSAKNSKAFADTAPTGDAFTLTRKFLEGHLSLLEAIPEYPRLLAWENLQGGKTLSRLPLRQTYDEFLNRVQVMLEPLARQGMLRKGFDLRHVAQAVIALTHYFLVYRGVIEHLFQMDPSQPQTRAAWLDYCANLLVSNLQLGSEAAPTSWDTDDTASASQSGP
jgi:TetR/AcrR family transcriptional regulator